MKAAVECDIIKISAPKMQYNLIFQAVSHRHRSNAMCCLTDKLTY